MSKEFDHNAPGESPAEGLQEFKRQKPEDRHGAGLIAAIAALLVLSAAAYWMSQTFKEEEMISKRPGGSPTSAKWPISKEVRPESPSSKKTRPSGILVRSDPAGARMTAKLDKMPLDVYFGFGKATLTDEAKALLKKHVDAKEPKRGKGDWSVRLQGYTDDRGASAFNRKLSLARANAVKRHLVILGIPGDSIEVVSRGEGGAVCAEVTEDCRRRNRRVHLDWNSTAGGTETRSVSLPSESSQKRDVSPTPVVALEQPDQPKGSPGNPQATP